MTRTTKKKKSSTRRQRKPSCSRLYRAEAYTGAADKKIITQTTMPRNQSGRRAKRTSSKRFRAAFEDIPSELFDLKSLEPRERFQTLLTLAETSKRARLFTEIGLELLREELGIKVSTNVRADLALHFTWFEQEFLFKPGTDLSKQLDNLTKYVIFMTKDIVYKLGTVIFYEGDDEDDDENYNGFYTILPTDGSRGHHSIPGFGPIEYDRNRIRETNYNAHTVAKILFSPFFLF